MQECETPRSAMELQSGETWRLCYRGSPHRPQGGSGGTGCGQEKEIETFYGQFEAIETTKRFTKFILS